MSGVKFILRLLRVDNGTLCPSEVVSDKDGPILISQVTKGSPGAGFHKD